MEAALCRYDSVETVAVVLVKDQNQQAQLVAYLVCRDGTSLDMEALRAYLMTIIPAYMISSVYVVLGALSLNSNGKVDRKALPVPGDVRASLGEEYTAMEQQLSQIWAEVLKLERVGIHDNIFDMGVHSLIATQVANRIRERMNVELLPSEMFEHPTVAALAEYIETKQSFNEMHAHGHLDPDEGEDYV